jgi:enoyl-CoA hydratase/carnithine racemase
MSLGFVPEGASSYTFPKAMGKQHANRLLLAAEKIPAQEMYISGLVTQVIHAKEPAEFLDIVLEKAKKIATFNAESLRMAKAQINRPIPLAEQREAGIREGHDLKVRLNSDESKEIMKQFADNARKAKL